MPRSARGTGKPAAPARQRRPPAGNGNRAGKGTSARLAYNSRRIIILRVAAYTANMAFPPTNRGLSRTEPLRPLPKLIFMSRWLQLPLYLGLIVAQAVYVYHFWVELVHLIEAAFGNKEAIGMLAETVIPAVPGATVVPPVKLTETTIMLVVLGLIDVVMISNLLIMVIVGGYETFVSRLHLEGHPDQPEWLSHVNASVLKVKLGTAIIGISSIHLLKTFINATHYDAKTIMAQAGIHLAFLLSAMAIAYCDRLMAPMLKHGEHGH